MSEFTPTPVQQAAIEITGSSLLVSAGAGSGKTKVLTERLMRYVLGGKEHRNCKDIDRFVIITFTQAAAGELRSRITDELIEAAASASADPNVTPEYLRHVRRQQALIGKAQIGTIHHFCLSILRENAQSPELSLPPDFRIINDERSLALREETLSDLLEERYADLGSYPGFEELVNSAGAGRDDSGLGELVLKIYDKMQCHPFPEKWVEEKLALYCSELADPEDSKWGKELLEDAAAIADYWSAEMDNLAALARKYPLISDKPAENLAASSDGIRELSRSLRKGWDSAVSCPSPPFGRLTFPRKLDPDTEEVKELIKEKRDECKKSLTKLCRLFPGDSGQIRRQLAGAAPSMRALLTLVLDFSAEFSKRKLQAGYADFSDLEHQTASLLINPDGEPTFLARRIASEYTEIMVDEYQDVSRVQDAIFHAVSKEKKNLFLVGDVKQSIYRFRLANPEIFNEKYNLFPLYDCAETGESAKILLSDNFRSRKEILDCANAVFSNCMSARLGDTDYGPDTALVCGSAAYSGTVPVPELTILGTGREDRKTAEAEYTAKAIEEFVRSGALITSGGIRRPVRYGDIAILLRSANAAGGMYRRALIRRGVPVMTGQGGGFFDTREISLMLSFLRLMDNPRRDPELVSVLSSPLFGFTADELALIRSSSDSHTGLWSALKNASDSPAVPEPLQKKISGFLSLLDGFRSRAADQTAERTVRMLMNGAGFSLIFSAMPDGAGRTANINRLITLASEYEKEDHHGLHSFVRYLERLKDKNSEIPSSCGDGDAVNIVSIHRSKGLEYPVVFLCDTNRSFNTQDLKGSVLIHEDLGFGPYAVDTERKVRCSTLPREAIKRRLKREMLSEEMRLLYVALTRPKEFLFITGSSSKPEDLIMRWQKRLEVSTDGRPHTVSLSESSSFLEWLVAAAAADGQMHLKYRVLSSEEPGSFTEDGKLSEAPMQTSEDSSNTAAEIRKRLEFRYPYEDITQLPSKITATGLKGSLIDDDPEAGKLSGAQEETEAGVHTDSGGYRKPAFLKDTDPLSSAERGTATHLALQHVDPAHCVTSDSVKFELERLTEEGILTTRQKDAVDIASIAGLFSSAFGKRILNADRIYREFRFSILCDAEKYLGKGGREQILLQGVADCCIEENGKLVIIDYKTDRIRSGEDFVKKTAVYTPQLRAYAEALGRILRKPVREAAIYFLDCGKEAYIDLPDSERSSRS